jgi:glycosyltransferase involved in cell wall biosynthesis
MLIWFNQFLEIIFGEFMPQTNKLSPSSGKIEPKVVILIPCLNEELSIAKVIQDFRNEIPEAEIIVFDNASTDRTVEIATAEGATVYHEKRRGKGFVVQSMFQKIEADLYVMVDGDDTYPADRVKALIEPVRLDQADMATGSRILEGENSQFHWVNLFGNLLFQYLINFIFKSKLTDILSGYRCMNRRMVKQLPLFARGFDIEVELTVKSLARGYRLAEIPVGLRPRKLGSYSKIRIVSDGIKILTMVFALMRDYKPFTTFGALGLLLIGIGLAPGLYAVIGFLETGLVEKFPSAILSVGMILSGLLSITVGLILHTLNRRFREMEYLMGMHFRDSDQSHTE